jgi:hypothetical protein
MHMTNPAIRAIVAGKAGKAVPWVPNPDALYLEAFKNEFIPKVSAEAVQHLRLTQFFAQQVKEMQKTLKMQESTHLCYGQHPLSSFSSPLLRVLMSSLWFAPLTGWDTVDEHGDVWKLRLADKDPRFLKNARPKKTTMGRAKWMRKLYRAELWTSETEPRLYFE